MRTTVSMLQKLLACECGESGGVKQDYADAERMAKQQSFNDEEWPKNLFSDRPVKWGLQCSKCQMHPWWLQPHAPFVLTRSSPSLLTCACGGEGRYIRQTFEDILKVHPNFHYIEDLRIYSNPVLFRIYSLPNCSVCHNILWQALPDVSSIVPLITIHQIQMVGIVERKPLVKGRRIERVEE